MTEIVLPTGVVDDTSPLLMKTPKTGSLLLSKRVAGAKVAVWDAMSEKSTR